MRIRRATVASDALPTSTEAALTRREDSIMRKLIAVGSFLMLSGLCWSGPAYSATKAATGGGALARSVTPGASEGQRIAGVLEGDAPLAGDFSAVAGGPDKIRESPHKRSGWARSTSRWRNIALQRSGWPRTRAA